MTDMEGGRPIYPEVGSEEAFAREQLANLRSEEAELTRRLEVVRRQIPSWEARVAASQAGTELISKNPAVDGRGQSVTFGG